MLTTASHKNRGNEAALERGSNRLWRFCGFLAMLVLVIAYFTLGPPAGSRATAEAQPDDPPLISEQVESVRGKLSPATNANLDYRLNELVNSGSFRAAGNDSARSQRSRQLAQRAASTEEKVSVDVLVEQGYQNMVLQFMRAHGADVRDPVQDQEVLFASVPISLLQRLSAQPGVERVVAAQRVDTLTALSGSSAHGATNWHDWGYRGGGVKIGVIDGGFSGYSPHIGSSLPIPAAVRCYAGNRAVQHNTLAACEEWSRTDHGSTVTEMLYGIAPSATYYLAAISHQRDMISAIDWFITNGVDVVSVSMVGNYEGPGDGTSPFPDSAMTSIKKAVDNGMFVAVAAGNSHNYSWYGTLTDQDYDNVLEWTPSDECNTVSLSEKKTYVFHLRWDDTWRAENPYIGAEIDLDLYIRKSGTIHAKSEELQGGNYYHTAIEAIRFTPSESGEYCISIEKRRGAIPGWTQLISTGTFASMEHTSDGYSIGSFGETVYPGVLTVGGALASNTQTMLPYSSRGPLPHGQLKPDIVGASMVHSAVLGRTEGGTSLSTPQVAGLAALAKQRFSWYTPAQIAQFLKENAQGRSSPVPNNTWGYGFAWMPPNPARATVHISGSAKVGQRLTASAVVGAPRGLNSTAFHWEWWRIDGQARTLISNSTVRGLQSTYILTGADEGKRITARCYFWDRQGNEEEFFAEPTGIVNPTFISSLGAQSRFYYTPLGAGTSVAQPFTTGQGVLGFNVDQVTIQMEDELPAMSAYTVGIHAEDSSAAHTPGDLVVSLQGDLTSTGSREFVPASPTVLDPNTQYFLVISVTSLSSMTSQPFPYSDQPHVTYKGIGAWVGSQGWVFHPSMYRSGEDSQWNQFAHVFGAEISGSPVPANYIVRFHNNSGYIGIAEGESSQVTLALERKIHTTESITIPISVAGDGWVDSSDYSGIPDSVTFESWETEKSFTVSAALDSEEEPPEPMLIKLVELPAGVAYVGEESAVVLILDGTVKVAFGAARYDVDEGGQVEVEVRLDESQSSELAIPISVLGREEAAADNGFTGNLDEYASSSSDYSDVPTSLTFVPGDTGKTFTFNALEETVDDDDERVVLSFGTLPAGVAADSTIHSGENGPRNKTTVFLGDNDLPDVRVSFGATSYTVDEGEQVEVIVGLSEPPEREVTIPIRVYAWEQAVSDGSLTGNLAGYASSETDFTGVPASLVFAPSDIEKTFTFGALEEMVDDDDEHVVLSFGTLPSQITADTTIRLGEASARDIATVFLGDNDVPDVTVRFGAPSYTVQEGETIYVEVEFDVDPERELAIQLVATPEGGTTRDDYLLAPVQFREGEGYQFSFTGFPDNESNESGERVKLAFAEPLPSQVNIDSTVPVGESLARNETVVAIVDMAAPPGRPAITAIKERAGQLVVGWTAPAANGGSNITGYTLRYILSSASNLDKTHPAYWSRVEEIQTNQDGVFSHTIRDLQNDSSYDVQLAAINAVGASIWSETVEATPIVLNNPPVVPESESGMRIVDEDANVGSAIGVPVAATDEDSELLSYMIAPPSEYIEIDNATGQLTVKAPLDYETATEHTILVTVSDLADPDAVADEVPDVDITVTVTVRDVNEPPVVSGNSEIDAFENSTEVLATYLATDPEGEAAIEWTLGGQDAEDFTISTNGELIFASPPDFENPTDENMDNEYHVRVRAKDARKTGRYDVVVRVSDNQPPVITGETAVSFVEGGTVPVAAYSASDPESRDSTFAWSLVGPDSSLFNLAADGSAATLTFIMPPNYLAPEDFDANNEYDVTIQVADEDGEKGALSVVVTVASST